MNLTTQRPWITPVVIGAFLLSAVTGVLMFFHLDSGLNKTAHEWLSWAMVIGVTLHLLLNVTAFKRYFTQTTGRVVIGLFVAVLALLAVDKILLKKLDIQQELANNNLSVAIFCSAVMLFVALIICFGLQS